MLSSIEHYQSVHAACAKKNVTVFPAVFFNLLTCSLRTACALKQPRTRAQYLTQRIYQAESKFAELMPKLCDTSVELKSRIALLESSVRTRLCYRQIEAKTRKVGREREREKESEKKTR